MSPLLLAVVIAAHSHAEGNPTIGPLRVGAPASTVAARLGPGTRARCWYGASGCAALAYTDGSALVRVALRNGEVDRIRVDANAPVAGIARLPRAAGAVARWTWDGGRILTLPTAIFPGWLPCGTAPIGQEWCGGPWNDRRALEMRFAVDQGRVDHAELARS